MTAIMAAATTSRWTRDRSMIRTLSSGTANRAASTAGAVHEPRMSIPGWAYPIDVTGLRGGC